MSHMWPFRYFGTHADIQDIFDPDDRVYPRASSRVGTKYQAFVVKWDGPGQVNRVAFTGSLGIAGGLCGRTRHSRNPVIPCEICRVAAYMERVKGLTLPLPSHSADVIDRALLALQQAGYDAEKAIRDLALVQKKDFDIRDWTPKEIESFEEGIRLYGHELFAIKKKVETRSMKDIVRFFYRWKKTERYQPVYSVFTKIHKPNKKFKSVGRGAVTSSAVEVGNRSKTGHELPKDSVLDYETIILPSADNAGKFACAHCGIRVTSIWRRLPGETDPESQFPRVYCNDCGNDWIRYVALPPLVDTQKDIKKSKGKDPSAKSLTNGSSKASPAASEVATAIKRKRSEAKTSVIKKVKEQSHEPTRSPSPLPELPCAIAMELMPRYRTANGHVIPARTIRVQPVLPHTTAYCAQKLRKKVLKL
ncbi:putative PHD type zinc finger protein with BAH domain-containing protein [Mortierella alpina]|nr:putative PHD type zinc finger protein with BAH domain-containing protein [Mortierella alpina]